MIKLGSNRVKKGVKKDKRRKVILSRKNLIMKIKGLVGKSKEKAWKNKDSKKENKEKIIKIKILNPQKGMEKKVKGQEVKMECSLK